MPNVDGVGYVDVTGSRAGHHAFAGTSFKGLHSSAQFGRAVAIFQFGNYDDDARLPEDDYNGDGCADLLVGDPGASGGGAVDVLLGSRTGAAVGSAKPIITARTSADDVGDAIAIHPRYAGDDSVRLVGTDVWVGAPGRTVDGHAGAGAVDHYFLSATHKLSLVETVTAATAAAHSQVQTDAHFGSVLATTGDGVLVGVPDQSVSGHAGAGAVTLVRAVENSAPHVVDEGSTISQNTVGVAGSAETGDHFGSSLTTGFFSDDSDYQDVAVGVPGEDVGSAVDAGMVNLVRYDSSAVLSVERRGDRLAGGGLTQNVPGVPGVAQAGNGFGAALSVAQSSDSSDNEILSIGTPGESVGTAARAGVVVRLQLSARDTMTAATVTQESVGAASETDDRFGQSLSGTPSLAYGPVGHLTIGVPGEDVGSNVHAGMAWVADATHDVNRRPVTLRTLSFPGKPAGLHYGAVLANEPAP